MDKAAGKSHKKEALQGSHWSQETVALKEAAHVGSHRPPQALPRPAHPPGGSQGPAGTSP